MLRTIIVLAFSSLAVVSARAWAQRPPIGVAPVALADTPYVFDTAEQHRIRVTVVARLKRPWSIAFLPSGDALISERTGQLRYLRNATGLTGAPTTLEPEPVTGVPPLGEPYFKGGLHEVALHPEFAQNNWVYFTFNKPGNPDPPAASAPGTPVFRQSVLLLMRAKLSGRALTQVQELFAGESAPSSGSRLAFGRDGMVYLAAGSPFFELRPQQLASVYGKVLRLTEDGKAPADNPFVGRADVRPEIYSYGHCDHYGLAVHPVTGALLNAENGPNGGDELNVILPGRNYGWPRVSFGLRSDGTPVAQSPVAEGVEPPRVVWLPSIVPSGLTFYTGDRFPAWKGNLFVGSINRGHIPHTGGIERVVLGENLGDVRREMLLTELHQRIRDVRQGPDGLLYALTDDDNGALLRIEPVS